MKSILKISELLLLTFVVTALSAQNPKCYIKKTYPASRRTTLHILNKYGDVNFVSNNSDSISVCVTINIEQENKELERKNMTFITVYTQNLNDTVSVITNFDRRFFTEANRKGRKSFSVDILIKAPGFINADIANEFGNVTVEELSGRISLRLSYGVVSMAKLTRGNTNPINSISIENGRANIKDVNWLSATIRNCSSIEIGKAHALLIQSDFSKIRIGSINSIVADSKSDIYSIDELKNIISESLYTSFEIGKLNGKMLSRVNYGSLSIASIRKDFSNIDITSVNSPITISAGNTASFRSDIVATDAPLYFDTKNQPGIIRNEKNNSVSCTGIFGDNPNTESVISIRSASGKVTIR